MHRQLTAILGNRLGQQHAHLLSRPELDPDGAGITWYAPPLGPVRKLADLPETERRPIETLRRRLLADIGALARKMQGEGASAELVAHMLELAVITPSGDAAYAVGAQPVLVLWGHAAEGQAVPDPPKFAVSPARAPIRGIPPTASSESEVAVPPEPAATPPAAPLAQADVETVATVGTPARRGWLPWLLPLLLLLLLALLVWRASQPLPPVIVERQAPAPPPPADPVPAEEEREKALRAELAELARARDERLALCKPVAPPPAPVKPPEPPKLTELAPLPPVPKPKPAPPAAEVKPKPEPPPKEARPAPPPEPPKDVAMTPMPPPVPPRSKCDLQVKPGDEPEVVVIVDGSGSMGEPFVGAPSRMAMAKDAIEHVVTGLPAPVDVALIDFSDCDRVRLDKFYSQPERPSLIREVRGLRPDRGTPLARSIERAGNIVSGDVESTIVVVSDGEDTCGRDPCAAARAVKAKRPNVTINVIDVSGERGRSMVQCIAGATGGKVLTPNSSLDMKNKVQQATRLPDTRNCR